MHVNTTGGWRCTCYIWRSQAKIAGNHPVRSGAVRASFAQPLTHVRQVTFSTFLLHISTPKILSRIPYLAKVDI